MPVLTFRRDCRTDTRLASTWHPAVAPDEWTFLLFALLGILLFPSEALLTDGAVGNSYIGRYAWPAIARALSSIILGLCLLVWPGASVVTLVLLYARYCLVDSLIAVGGGYYASLWPSIVIGVVDLTAGTVVLMREALTTEGLLYVMAGWALARGALELMAGVRLGETVDGWHQLLAAGAWSFAFGTLLALIGSIKVLSLMWLLGGYALAYGALLLAVGVRLRRPRIA